MEPVFRQKHTISAIHLDCYGRTKPSVLLYFVQEAAGAHCSELSVDWDTLAKRHMFWAVIRHRMQISRLPSAGETITVETWPTPTTRSAFPRSTIGYDENGNELFRSISLWVLMDTHSRNMILPGKSGVSVTGTLRGIELAPPRSILPESMTHEATKRVGYTELDRNGHMNNTRYLDWIEDLLPSAFHAENPVRDFTVCYLSEATEQQEVSLFWKLSDDNILHVDAYRKHENTPEKTDRVFSAQVHF